MPHPDWLSWPVVDAGSGSVTLSLGVASIGAGLVLLFLLLAIFRAGFDAWRWALLRGALVVILAITGWALLQRLAERESADERRVLEERAQQCEELCEKAVFAGPESVAAALAYVGARLALLADAADFVNRSETSYSAALLQLRAALEADRFDLVAQLLSRGGGCAAPSCGSLGMLAEPARASANLKEHTFERLLRRYATGWAQPSQAAAVLTTGTATQPSPSPASLTNEPAAAIPPAAPASTPPVPPRRTLGSLRGPQPPIPSAPFSLSEPANSAGSQPPRPC